MGQLVSFGSSRKTGCLVALAPDDKTAAQMGMPCALPNGQLCKGAAGCGGPLLGLFSYPGSSPSPLPWGRGAKTHLAGVEGQMEKSWRTVGSHQVAECSHIEAKVLRRGRVQEGRE